MASNGEYIEVLSSSAIADVQKINKEITKLVTNVNTANGAFKGLKVPSEFKNSISQLNSVLKQSNALLRAQVQLQASLANSANNYTDATKNSTQAIVQNERAERERIKTERERLRYSEDQRRVDERKARAAQVLGGAYLELSRKEREAARNVQDLIARGRTAEQTQRQYNRELRTAQKDFEGLNRRVLMADRAVGRFNRNVGNYPNQAVAGLRDLMGAFGVVGGATAFAAITRNIFETTKELQSLDLALNQVLGSTDKAAQAQSFLTRISEAYGIEITGLTRSYTQFYAAAQNAIDANLINATQIEEIFESVSKASGAMGLSAEQQQGAFLALQQMISKGTIQAEEIRGQLAERLPGAFGILAKSMGVTEIELNKLLKDGKVLAAEVLPAFAKQLEIAYGVENLDRVRSLAAETSRLKNEWTDFVRVISEGDSAISKFFNGFLSELKETLKFYKELAMSDEQKLDKTQEAAYKSKLDYLKKLTAAQQELQAIELSRVNAATITMYEQENRELRKGNEELEKRIENLRLDAPRESAGAIASLTDQYNRNTQTMRGNSSMIAVLTGQLQAAGDILREEEKIVKSSTETSAKKHKADIDYLKEVFELRKQNTENLIAEEERIMENEEKNYDVRLEAAENYYALKENLLEAEMQEQIRINNLEAKNQTEIYRNAIAAGEATAENLNQIEYKRFQKEQTILAEHLGKKNELTIESAKKLKGVLDAIEDQRKVNTVDEKQLDDIRQLNMELANVSTGTSYAKFKELEERKTAIVEDATEERIRIELRRTQAQIEALNQDELNSKAYQDLRNKEIKLQTDLATAEQERLEKSVELTKELKTATDEYIKSISSGALSDFGMGSLATFFDGTFDKLMAGADTLEEKFAVAFTAISEVAQEAFAFINQASAASFQAQYADLDQRQQIALKYAGESQAAQEEVNKQYEERRKELKRKELQAQKEQAIFNAIINTAQGVTAALAQANIPLSIIIGALGAAQIAFIAGQQIPAYKMGTDNHGGGLMMVNDASGSNYREMVQTPDGQSFIPQDRNVIMNAPKGTRVLTADKTMRELNEMLMTNDIAPFADVLTRDRFGGVVINQSGGGITKDEMAQLMSKYQNKETLHFSLDRRGINTYWKGKDSINKETANSVKIKR